MQLEEYALKTDPCNDSHIEIHYEPYFCVLFRGKTFINNYSITSYYHIAEDKLQNLYKHNMPLSIIMLFCHKLARWLRGETNGLKCELWMYAMYTDLRTEYAPNSMVAHFDKQGRGREYCWFVYDMHIIYDNNKFSSALGTTSEELYKCYGEEMLLDDIINRFGFHATFGNRDSAHLAELRTIYSDERISKERIQWGLSFYDLIMYARVNDEESPDLKYSYLKQLGSEEFLQKVVHKVDIDFRGNGKEYDCAEIQLYFVRMQALSEKEKLQLISAHKNAIFSYAIRQVMTNPTCPYLRNQAKKIKIDKATFLKNDILAIVTSWDPDR